MSTGYLVRYGAMRNVGRFAADQGAAYRRGDRVVVRSRRGEELGEVVSEAEVPPTTTPRVLRSASEGDANRARVASSERGARLESIERVFRDGEWPIVPIDAEPMLDDARTVLLYLGPHKLDASALAEALKLACGLDVVFEPVGLDSPEEALEEADHGCGSCGTGGGCGSGGGGCGTSGGGCDGCAVKSLVRDSRAVAAV